MQNRMDQVLETGHLGNELCSSGHHATARLGFFVRHPDFRQKAARVELGQYCGVDLVGLDLGPGDGPDQNRIGYDDAPNRASRRGRPDNNSSSQLMACPPCVLPTPQSR